MDITTSTPPNTESVCTLGSVAQASGQLRITLVYADREEVVVDEKNVISLQGKQRLLQTLYAVQTGSSTITNLYVGTGGTVDPEGRFPKPVNSSLTNLFGPLTSVPVTYTLLETYPSITYIADIDPTLCNGSIISEAGLFFSDDVMFNIKTFPGIPKTVDFSIHFEWTVKIS